MSELVEFLLARWAEDEEAARATVGTAGGEHWIHPDDGEVTSPNDLIAHPPRVAYAAHIARHDPARVLAEVAAKRRIVEYAGEATSLDAQVDGEFRVGRRDTATEPYVGDLILRALASVYADHPEFREEWGV